MTHEFFAFCVICLFINTLFREFTSSRNGLHWQAFCHRHGQNSSLHRVALSSPLTHQVLNGQARRPQ